MIDDTSPEARRVQAEIESRLTPLQRLRILDGEWATARTLLRAGLRLRFPEDPPDQIEARLFGVLLGEELGARVWEERCRRRGRAHD